MVKRIGGFRRKTRHKLAKNYREKGKLSLVKYFQQFKTGDKVCLVAEPSKHNGMYHPRFHGRVGTVDGKKGNCYEVQIRDGNMRKSLIVHPIHLKRL
ncbi:50S ribosomal protein L21e [Candidatus Woesearchaeota archaeon]|nr:50S ribosomal protein L21e [Candidatus Woesearchaeota archaeon]